MEFPFNVNDIFKEPVVEINRNLLPPGFNGNRKSVCETINKTSEVINAMGEASAKTQGLSKPVTTADRLRQSENQKLYLMVDHEANDGKGAVTGMLKTGNKGLYVFDKQGQHHQVSPPCVLDFYVHESRQRNGLGKQLYEHMLEKEQVQPVEMAVDKPNDKFLNFLNKHYSLNAPIKQMNNFVVFDGFFPGQESSGDSEISTPIKRGPANGLQSTPAPYGRYIAPRPVSTMGQIIHNEDSPGNRNPLIAVQSLPATNYQSCNNPQQNLQPSQSTVNMHYKEASQSNCNMIQDNNANKMQYADPSAMADGIQNNI